MWGLWGGDGFDAQVIFQIVSWTAFGLIGLWLLATGRVRPSIAASGAAVLVLRVHRRWR